MIKHNIILKDTEGYYKGLNMQEENQHISFSVLQEAIRQSRYNALKAANAELVNLYWQVGAFVRKQLGQSQWGDKTVEQLANFLQKEDPALKGFDKRAIYRMVEFYEKYHASSFVVSVRPQIQSAKSQSNKIVVSVRPQLETQPENEVVATVRRQIEDENIRHTILTKISWTHNRTIFSRCKQKRKERFTCGFASKKTTV